MELRRVDYSQSGKRKAPTASTSHISKEGQHLGEKFGFWCQHIPHLYYLLDPMYGSLVNLPFQMRPEQQQALDKLDYYFSSSASAPRAGRTIRSFRHPKFHFLGSLDQMDRQIYPWAFAVSGTQSQPRCICHWRGNSRQHTGHFWKLKPFLGQRELPRRPTFLICPA